MPPERCSGRQGIQNILDQRPGLRPGLFYAKWNFSNPYILLHTAAWRVDWTRATRRGTFNLAFQSVAGWSV